MASLPVYIIFVPIGIVLLSLAVVGGLFVAQRLSADNVSEIIESLVYVSAAMLIIMLFVRFVCLDIHPVELFTAPDPIAALWADIIDAEATVCTYMTRADHFIQNQVGKPGHDDPSLLAVARQNARTAAGGALTDCSAGTTLDDSLDEAENRIQRIETTLNGFTSPIFQQAYTASNTCESFVDTSGTDARLTDLRQRIAAIQQVLVLQKKKYLDPIDAKQQALQSGQMSDCDKKRGGAVGANIAGGSPAPAG